MARTRGVKTVKPGIALLLTGSEADLSTAICAVQLAARSGSDLFAVRDCVLVAGDAAAGRQGGYSDCFGFVVEFAGGEGVPVSCHLMEEETGEQMAAFLLAHGITCLVIGKDDAAHGRESAWLQGILERLAGEGRDDLRLVMAPELDEAEMRRAVRQFRRVDAK